MSPKLILSCGLIFTFVTVTSAQSTSSSASSQSASSQTATSLASTDSELVTVPAGTKVMLALIHPISTKSARPGDGVYLRTTFPVVMNDVIVIPPGTYVQGEITEVERHIRVKGRAELRFRFTTFIFPNGYTVSMPGAVNNVPGMEQATMKDKEGTVRANGDKGKQAATVGGVAATGAVIGVAADGLKGAGIGGGMGAVAGLAVAMLTHGPDVRLESGTAVEMVLERALALDRARLEGTSTRAEKSFSQPRSQRPVLVPPPQQ